MKNKIICGDCLETMKEMHNKSIDMVLTSPPYDNLRKYNGNLNWGEHVWKPVIEELFRIIKDGRVVVWVTGDATIKGSETGTSFKQALYFKEVGFNLHDTMIYRKINYIPLTHNRYEQEFEYMFVLSKGKPKVFNPIKIPTKLGGKTYNPKRPRTYDNHSIRHNRSETLIYKMNKIKGNIFEYITGAGNDKTNHSATFPEKLAHDHIISWSNEGDTILDPFAGSGTTGKMAKQLNRNYILIEKEPEYCKIAEERIKGMPVTLFNN